MSKVTIKNITKSYGDKKVLENISLEVLEGEFLSILGPSGCGKSTLLKIVAGLTDIEEGQIFFDDEDYTFTSTNKRGAIIVFQDYSLFTHMNVYDNIAYGLKARGVKKDIIKEKVLYMLETISLLDKKKAYPSELSGGQMQRVAIARALILQPKVLLLDEPFSGLDNSLKEQMKAFVLEITKKFKITTLMVTHDKEEALSMSDKVAIIIDKRIEQFDIPKNIYEKPVSVKVAKFLANYNILSYEEARELLGKEKIELLSANCNLVINHNSFLVDEKGFEFKVLEKGYMGMYTTYVVGYGDIVLRCNLDDDKFMVGDTISLKIKEYSELK